MIEKDWKWHYNYKQNAKKNEEHEINQLLAQSTPCASNTCIMVQLINSVSAIISSCDDPGCMTDRRLKIMSNYPVSNLPIQCILSLLRQWTSSNELFSSNYRPTSSEQATISATFFFFFHVQLQYVEEPDIMRAYLL